jgi:hypothetical protein
MPWKKVPNIFLFFKGGRWHGAAHLKFRIANYEFGIAQPP